MTPPSRRTTRRLQPLTVTSVFKAFVLDQLEELGNVTPRAMFGGVGLYCGDVFFGIIARDTLYLKVDATNRPDYDRAGMGPFMPYPGRPGTGPMKYYAVPTEILESAIDLAAWARKSVAVAERSATRGAVAERRATRRAGKRKSR